MTKVSQFEHKKPISQNQLNIRSAASRVLADIIESLLYHTEHCKLTVPGKPTQLRINSECYTDTATTAKTTHIPTKRVRKAKFVEHWRMQKIADSADVAGRLLREVKTASEELAFVGVQPVSRLP